MIVYRRELSPQEVELSVHADLVSETTPEFRNALYAELDQPHRILKLDFERVRIINSSALGAILLFQKKAREVGKKIMIAGCNEELRRTMLAIRLDRIIEIQGEAPPTLDR